MSNVLAVPDGAQIQVKTNDVDKVTRSTASTCSRRSPTRSTRTPRRPTSSPGRSPTRRSRSNARAYNRDALVPAKPADADSLGAMRDLNIGGLQIPTAQYNARPKTLKVLKSVDVTLNFEGGPHTFSDELGNPWEQPSAASCATLLNANVVSRVDLREHHPPLR